MEGLRIPDFDIENLIDFHPLRRWCGRCFALWKEHRIGMSPNDDFFVDTSFKFVKCKICNGRMFIKSLIMAVFLSASALPAYALVCTVKAIKGVSYGKPIQIEFGVVARPGKADELFNLITQGMHNEAAHCCIACLVPVGTKILITQQGSGSHTIRVLDGESRGCVGTLTVESIGNCK